jgi:hypothetical protein
MLRATNRSSMLSVIMLKAVILSVVMLSAVILSVVMVNAVILSVIMLNAVILSAVMLNAVIMSVIMLNAVILSVVMLNPVILSVVMLSVEGHMSPKSFTIAVKAGTDNYHASLKNLMVEKRSSLFTTSMSATKKRVLWHWHQEEDGLGQDVGDEDEDGADLWPML